MGAGIAQVAVQAGCEVWLFDATLGAVELARDRIARGLDRAVERGTLTEQARGAAVGRLHQARELGDMARVQLVVEAVVEREATKAEVLGALDRILAPDGILASN